MPSLRSGIGAFRVALALERDKTQRRHEGGGVTEIDGPTFPLT